MFCCPPKGLSRRLLLAAGASAAVLRPRFAAASVGTNWIDVHCHVFNAIDLPMVEFVAQTSQNWVATALTPVLELITTLMKSFSPTAALEAQWLASGAPMLLAEFEEVSTLAVLRAINDPVHDPLPPPPQGYRRVPPPQNGPALLRNALYGAPVAHEMAVPGAPAVQKLSEPELQQLADMIEPQLPQPLEKLQKPKI